MFDSIQQREAEQTKMGFDNILTTGYNVAMPAREENHVQNNC